MENGVKIGLVELSRHEPFDAICCLSRAMDGVWNFGGKAKERAKLQYFSCGLILCTGTPLGQSVYE